MDEPLLLLAGALLVIAGSVAGYLIVRLRLWREVTEIRARNTELARREQELEQIVQRIQGENKNLSAFLVMLPDVARRLNSHLERRSVAPLLASVLQHIFEPAQILIFFTQREEKCLFLAHRQGASERLAMGTRVRMNEGMIGWVATHLVTMDKEDFHQHTDLRRGEPSRALLEATAQIELIAPMMYEDECLGVIALGGISKRASDPKRMIKMVADIGSLAVYNHMLYTSFQSMANSDQLTKMYTKRYLLIRMGEEIHKAEHNNLPLSVFIFDIDHFKKYNDTHGHLAGDDVLRAVGRLVLQAIRVDDVAARYGGEEFVVILPNTTKENAHLIADKIRRVIEAHPFLNEQTQPGGKVTISGGVATLGQDGRTTNELLGCADQALYLAKEQGRNRIVSYKIRYLSDEEEEEVRA